MLNSTDITEIKSSIETELKKLRLKTNDKTDIGSLENGFEYLGYLLNSSKITVRESSLLKFEQSLEQSLNEIRTQSPEYITWKINLKITGFIYSKSKYGWLFFYSQITDLQMLFRLDHLVEKLLKRKNLETKIHCKKFVRTYHEINKALHTTNYIPNFDKYTTDDKRRILSQTLQQDFSQANESRVEESFSNLISKEIRSIEKDIQPFS